MNHIDQQTTGGASILEMDRDGSLPRQPRPDVPHSRIQPSRGWSSLRLDELWVYRELLYFFAWRDLKVRYKQTILGALWAIIQPFLTMIIFTIFFGRLAQVPSDGFPYPIFTYTALVPWTFFANALTQASNSLVLNANMLKKIYFPRPSIPIATVLAGIVDFILAFAFLLVLMAFYRLMPTANVVWLPFFLLLTVCTSMGVGLWLSALNVQFRDVRYITPFLTQIWLFATPIAYSSTLVPEHLRPLYALNPMVGVVEGFRWALLGTDTNPGVMIIVSSVTALLLLGSGFMYFRRMEKNFADII